MKIPDYMKLSDAKELVESVAGASKDGWGAIKTLAEMIVNTINTIGDIINNPLGFINSLEPILMIIILVLIVLKGLGFNTSKYIGLAMFLVITIITLI